MNVMKLLRPTLFFLVVLFVSLNAHAFFYYTNDAIDYQNFIQATSIRGSSGSVGSSGRRVVSETNERNGSSGGIVIDYTDEFVE